MNVLLYALILCGCVYLVTQSVILEPARNALLRAAGAAVAPPPPRTIKRALFGLLAALVVCPPCFGFWAGAILYMLGYWPFEPVVWGLGEAALGSCALGAAWSTWSATE